MNHFRLLAATVIVCAGYLANTANLMLVNCALRNNHANGGSTASGAGIYTSQSQLAVTGCLFDSNVATGNGGSIYNIASTLTIDKSTMTGNSGINGGGIFNSS